MPETTPAPEAPETHPEVKFDKAKRQNYHVEGTTKVFHGIPPGFHFDEAGNLTPIHPHDIPQLSGEMDTAILKAHHDTFLKRQAEKAATKAEKE